MRTRIVIAGGVLVALAVAGCSGSGGNGSSAGGDVANDAVASGAVAAPAAGPASAAASAAGGSSGSTAGDGSRADTASVRLSTGAKIRTAAITVSVAKGSVAARADQAGAIAERAGGEIDSDDRTSGASATASLRLLVPPPALFTVLSDLAKLGHEDSRTLSSRDVTTEVADVASRVTSARAAIARLTDLYSRSSKVGDVIAIESELAQRQADLESLEAQQKALAARTSLATITLSLRTAVVPVVHHHSDRSGIGGGFVRGWHAFTTAAGAVATGVATALPFLVLLALALLAARLLWTRLGRRPHPIPVPSGDPTP